MSSYARLSESSSEEQLRAKVLLALRAHMSGMSDDMQDDEVMARASSGCINGVMGGNGVIDWLRLAHTVGLDGTQQRITSFYSNISLLSTLYLGIAFTGLVTMHTLGISSAALLNVGYALSWVSLFCFASSVVDGVFISNGVVKLATVHELNAFICHSPLLLQIPALFFGVGNLFIQMVCLLIIQLFVSVPVFAFVATSMLMGQYLMLNRYYIEVSFSSGLTRMAMDGVVTKAELDADDVAA